MPKPISGIILIRSLSTGGAERQAIEIAASLNKRGFNTAIMVFYGNGALESEALNKGIRVIDLKKGGRWDFFSFLLNLRAILLKEKPDFVYSLLTGANIIACLLKVIRPQTPIIWGIRAADKSMDIYDVPARVTTLLETKLSFIPDHVIANSHAGREVVLERGYPSSKVSVITNGINTELYFPSQDLRSEIRQQWGLRPEQKAIGLIGRLDPVKGHDVFFEAASEILRSVPSACFFIIGDGPAPYRERLELLSGSLGLGDNLVWIPFPESMNAIYNGLDVIVSSSFFEGTSNVICEAMACGKPCIVTDVGDSARIAGGLGRVVPPGDALAISNALTSLLEEEAPQPEQLRGHIIKQYGLEQLGMSTKVLIEEVIACTSST